VYKSAWFGPSFVRASLLAAGIGIAATCADAQSVDNVLLVVNDSSPASLDIGAYYAAKRAVPDAQVLTITVDPSDEIARPEFEARVERPIAQWITREAAQDRILYIVLTKGVPLRIQGTPGGKGTIASVDSELTLLYRKLAGSPVTPIGPLPNPYFLATSPLSDTRPFSHERHDIYLVTRLDGFTLEDVKGLIDRGVSPATTGTIVLDQRAGSTDPGDRWLQEAADALKTTAPPTIRIDAGVAAPSSARDEAFGYYSWGSNDPAIHARRPMLSFAPGALAATFAGTDARTFTEPPSEWRFGRWDDQRSYFAGAPASLTGDLIREGVTGAAGSVADPFLEGSVRPSILFQAYLSGRNLAEAFYLATPFLSWQTVVIGDPLCTPFHGEALRAEEANPEADSVTELPRFFSARRLQLMSLTGIKPDALKLYARAESRVRKQDSAAARQALEEATTIDERLVPAHAMLAGLYEEAREYDKAVERYRRVLAYSPADVPALNNLAYVIAVRQGQPHDALPLAEKAYSIASGNPSVADTLGWIHHLLGDDAAATPLVTRAINGLPGSAEVQLHAATIFAALGQLDSASAALARAVTLDTALEQRRDVQQLRSTLGALPTP